MSISEFQPRHTKRQPGRSIREAFKGAATTKLTVNLDIDLHKKLKQRALDEDRTMRDILEDLLHDYLETDL